VLEDAPRRLLDRAGLDVTLYEMPGPQTPQEEWHRVSRLLFAAESHHLATRPTGDLSLEHRDLTRILTATVTERMALRPELRRDAIGERQRADPGSEDPSAATALDKGLRLLDAARFTRSGHPTQPHVRHPLPPRHVKVHAAGRT